LLYDNNVNVTNGDKKTSGKYSQAVQYKINTKTMTIDQTWSYGKSLGKSNFTNIIGYAERETNGNTLIDFGFKKNGQESNVIEVDSDGNQVFNVTIKNAASKAYAYRAYRMSFYPDNYVFDVNK
jgi:Arylsulfotransferase (ASST).